MMLPPMSCLLVGSSASRDRKSTRLNSSHTVIYTLSLHDALPIYLVVPEVVDAGLLAIDERRDDVAADVVLAGRIERVPRSEEHTSELQSHSDLHSFPTRRSSDLPRCPGSRRRWPPCDRRATG